MTKDSTFPTLRATRALAALRGEIDEEGKAFVRQRQGRFNEPRKISYVKLAELELLRATCDTVAAPPRSGYDDLLIDHLGRVFDSRTGDELYDDEIIRYAKSQDDEEPQPLHDTTQEATI